MTGSEDQRAAARWDALDEALAELRGCRTVDEIERCVCVLARRACGADEAAVAVLRGGTWRTWSRDVVSARTETTAGPVPALVGRQAPHHRTGPDVACTEGLPDGRRRVLVPVPAVHAGWSLELVMPTDACDATGLELAASFAASLGRTMAAVAVLQRVEEQRFVLARLTSGVASGPERSVELLDSPPQDGEGSPAGDGVPGGSTSSVDERLSPRQREVLDLMVRGLSNAEIAERLVVSVPTVKSHVRAVLRACGAVNRSEAITRLARGGVTPV